jgi:hypothetical protein
LATATLGTSREAKPDSPSQQGEERFYYTITSLLSQLVKHVLKRNFKKRSRSRKLSSKSFEKYDS